MFFFYFLLFFFFIILWHRHAIIVTINFIFYYIFKTAFPLFVVMKMKKKIPTKFLCTVKSDFITVSFSPPKKKKMYIILEKKTDAMRV